ncbi:uncharacterized protein G2W53_000821 [Senna tora]|uniref:Uncharacterized protein n=1 Tax=Senna tora TaxID=362788 RepID=A0A835CJT7_9FABA|nr:uncharacterized protein G2W53_000821 [Senna tora]
MEKKGNVEIPAPRSQRSRPPTLIQGRDQTKDKLVTLLAISQFPKKWVAPLLVMVATPTLIGP